VRPPHPPTHSVSSVTVEVPAFKRSHFLPLDGDVDERPVAQHPQCALSRALRRRRWTQYLCLGSKRSRRTTTNRYLRAGPTRGRQ
jgi:hypothetical protein